MKMKFDTGDLIIKLRGADIFNPRERAKKFAEMARSEIESTSRLNDSLTGHHVPYKTSVDGAETSDLYRAKETSRIEADWELGAAVIEYIYHLLMTTTPVGRNSKHPGLYRKSMMMFADGKEIDDPKKALGAKDVLFVSTVAYARKIERGKKGYSPGHVYEGIAAMAKGRFGNIARINFTYREPLVTGTHLDVWALSNAVRTEGHSRKQTKKFEKNRRNPAIVVYLRG
jgi:hypothetical protein